MLASGGLDYVSKIFMNKIYKSSKKIENYKYCISKN